jgi:hypothetical protein
MISEVRGFKELLLKNLEIDDEQAVDIVIAVAMTHKLSGNEMLWLRIIGASGTGKTELLRTLAAQKGYCTQIESFTAGAIRRGFKFDRKTENQVPLLQRINGTLVITKEFASLLTKNPDDQNQILGLLRSIHDGELDADYGSEEGHLHQVSKFDWIIGTTQFVDRQRQLEQQLGSRFIDLRWGSPIQRNAAIEKAIENDGNLDAIRHKLADAMSDVIRVIKMAKNVKFDYIPELANIAAHMRTPVAREKYSHEISDIPDIELGTRIGQSLSRIATGLMSIGVEVENVRPYLNRITLDSMTRIRSEIVKAWMGGLKKQNEIAAKLELTQSAISRIIDEFRILGWQDSWLDVLSGRHNQNETNNS